MSKRIHDRCPDPPTITGLDVSPVVVARNRDSYAGQDFEFILDDPAKMVGQYDLITVRQVLQHNSNADVQRILARLRGRSRYLVIADAVARQPKVKNIDIATGGWTRIPLRSGVFVDAEPFNVPVDEVVVIDWPPEGAVNCVLRVTFSCWI